VKLQYLALLFFAFLSSVFSQTEVEESLNSSIIGVKQVLIETEKDNDFLFFPSYYKKWSNNYYLGLSLSQLPTKIVEDVFDQLPIVDFKYRLGLPQNLGISLDINSNVFTNLVKLGGIYSFSYKKFSASSGFSIQSWYGFYDSEGFDVSVFGWGYSPSVTLGYDFSDFYLSFKAEANIKTQNVYVKRIKTNSDKPKFVGFSLSLSVEQPLWKDNYFVIGFNGNITKFFYKSWISFSTFDEYIFIPEFFVGFIL